MRTQEVYECVSWPVEPEALARWCQRVIKKYGTIETDLFIARLKRIGDIADA